jgi:hypothetical protein
MNTNIGDIEVHLWKRYYKPMNISFEEGRERKDWEQAIKVQYDTLIKNQMWELVPCLKGINVIGCKWFIRQNLIHLRA